MSEVNNLFHPLNKILSSTALSAADTDITNDNPTEILAAVAEIIANSPVVDDDSSHTERVDDASGSQVGAVVKEYVDRAKLHVKSLSQTNLLAMDSPSAVASPCQSHSNSQETPAVPSSAYQNVGFGVSLRNIEANIVISSPSNTSSSSPFRATNSPAPTPVFRVPASSQPLATLAATKVPAVTASTLSLPSKPSFNQQLSVSNSSSEDGRKYGSDGLEDKILSTVKSGFNIPALLDSRQSMASPNMRERDDPGSPISTSDHRPRHVTAGNIQETASSSYASYYDNTLLTKPSLSSPFTPLSIANLSSQPAASTISDKGEAMSPSKQLPDPGLALLIRAQWEAAEREKREEIRKKLGDGNPSPTKAVPSPALAPATLPPDKNSISDIVTLPATNSNSKNTSNDNNIVNVVNSNDIAVNGIVNIVSSSPSSIRNSVRFDKSPPLVALIPPAGSATSATEIWRPQPSTNVEMARKTENSATNVSSLPVKSSLRQTSPKLTSAGYNDLKVPLLSAAPYLASLEEDATICPRCASCVIL